MSRPDDHQKLQTAISLHQKGNVNEAAKLYRTLIKTNPNNFYALHFLGVIEAGVGNIEKAKLLMARSLSIQPPNVQFIENYSTVLFQAGDYQSALKICQQGLQLNSANAALLYLSAILLYKLSKLKDAIAQFDKLLLLQPNHIAALNERGSVLAELKQFDAALNSIEKALALDPRYPEAQLNKGNLLSELKRYDDAIIAFDKALAVTPNLANAWLGRGIALRELKRHDDAFVAFDKALSLKPDLAEAWLGRGNVYFDLKRHDDAIAAYDKALALKPNLAGLWLGRGNIFRELKRHNEALAAYDKALALKPDLAEAWFGRGNVHFAVKRYEEAFAAYDKTLALKPDFADAWLGRGNIFFELKRYDEAMADYDKALAVKSNFAEAWFSRGNVFFELKRFDDAVDSFDRAFLLKPDLPGLEGSRLHAKMSICNWNNFNAECDHLIASVRSGKVAAEPFALFSVPSAPEDQLQCAKLWIADKHPPAKEPIWRSERYEHDRIRVAYLSADFREHHPVSFLIPGVFECHDKPRFDVTAISLAPDDHSDMHRRLKAAFERFIDAHQYSDERIASLIKELEIDILVDLMGLTKNSQTGVYARRCAPVQASYLGYAGTMGAEYIDYILADRFVIPEEKRGCYSEKVVYLPNSFMANDCKRRISERAQSRTDNGLPETGFVFCSFNNSYKFSPQVFDIWMRLLRRIDNSVLWLSNLNEAAARNLKTEAQNRGVDPSRLVFAQRAPLNEDHLARHRLADLFLDTLPYNAHTTASDALWAGLPVLTLLGETFAGRVAGSLLNAIHLPELIATTSDSYERMAFDLATHPEKLANIKHRLAENRLKTPLFDTKLFTKHIEAAYTAMHERHQAGLAPDHIAIPN